MASAEVDLAIQRFDLKGYVREKGGERAGRDEALVDCPTCFRKKLSVNLADKTWHCFICERYEVGIGGYKRAVAGAGNLVGLVMALEKLGARDAIDFIMQRAAGTIGEDGDLPEEAPRGIDTFERVPTGLPEHAIPVDGTLPYLLRRGITPEDSRWFGLHYVPWQVRSWCAGRLVFPVWENGRVLYWQSRAMWDEAEHKAWFPGVKFKKTLNPAVYFCARCRVKFPDGYSRCSICGGPQQYGSSDVLLNLEGAAHFARSRGDFRIAMCEGPTSTIRAGFDAVATFGKHLQPMQIARLVGAGIRAVDMMYDGPTTKEPRGAWPEMAEAAVQLAPHFDVRLVFLPKDDPGTYPRSQLDWFRSRAPRLQDVDVTQLLL